MAMFVVGVILVLIDAGRRRWTTLHGTPIPKQAFGSPLWTARFEWAAVDV